ncbi:hypothetical protein [Brucella pituitosa]|uniref:hypothetical protein n=1 Tax=Brucella pituitosa TaxID=571256 RepID=UPI001FFD9B2F|nr:hypothetical protein [Brucella pituitosa]
MPYKLFLNLKRQAVSKTRLTAVFAEAFRATGVAGTLHYPFVKKLKEKAVILRAGGWVEIVDALPFANKIDRVYPQPIPLTVAQHSQLDTLEATPAEVIERFERKEAANEDIESEAALEKEIGTLRNQGEAYGQSDNERSSCYVTVDYYGKLCVEHRLIRPYKTEDTLIRMPRTSHRKSIPKAAQPPLIMPAAFKQERSAQSWHYSPTLTLTTIVPALFLPLYSYGRREQIPLEIMLSNIGPESSIKDAAEVKPIQTTVTAPGRRRASLSLTSSPP